MKNTKLSIGLALLSLLFFAFTSCEDEASDPDYVGTWIHQESMDFYGSGVEVPIQITMVLTQSSFEWSFGVQAETEILNIGTVKGDMTATDNELTLMPTSVGMINQDGEYDWANKGEPGWDAALGNWEMEETMTSEYTVSGNTLTLDIDGEAMSFARE